MACFKPLKAWRGRKPTPGGKLAIVWKKEDGCGIEVDLPCGQCIGCRLQRSRDWAVRCVHEASLHQENCFITCTYRPESVPDDGGLRKEHFQKFMKRLRKAIAPREVRYFHCGEYGERLSRPHYHACLFGYDFPDKKPFKEVTGGTLYVSEMLDSIWGLGFCSVGAVTFESAAYVARYVMGKVVGDAAAHHYMTMNEETGELYPVIPEYVTMSRRPGIASAWFERWGGEVYPNDEVIMNGHAVRPPRFYDKLFEAAHGDIKEVKDGRLAAVLKHAENNTPQRLRVREIVTTRRLELLKRGMDGN